MSVSVSSRRCRRRGPGWPIMRPRCWPDCGEHGAVEIAPERCDVAALPPRQQRAACGDLPPGACTSPAWWCCTTPCCTISSSANSTRPPISRSLCTTTASGTAGWPRDLWRGRAASGADGRYFRLPDAAARRGARRARWWCTIRRRRATVREHAPRRPGGRDSAPVCAAGVALRGRSDPLPADARRRPGALSVRRLRISAGIEAADGRAGGFRANSIASSRDRAAGGRASSSRRTWNARSRRCCRARVSCACRISGSANSGWRRRPWMPASTCAIRRRARRPASRSV